MRICVSWILARKVIRTPFRAFTQNLSGGNLNPRKFMRKDQGSQSNNELQKYVEMAKSNRFSEKEFQELFQPNTLSTTCKDLESLSKAIFIFRTFTRYKPKYDGQIISKLYQRIIPTISTQNARDFKSSVNTLVNIWQNMERMRMKPDRNDLFERLIRDHLKDLTNQNFVYLLRMIENTESFYQHQGTLKENVNQRMKALDFFQLANILYVYFRSTQNMNLNHLEIPDCEQILREISLKYPTLGKAGKYDELQFNKSITKILNFLGDCLLDDEVFFKGLSEYMDSKESVLDLETLSAYVYTSAVLGMQNTHPNISTWIERLGKRLQSERQVSEKTFNCIRKYLFANERYGINDPNSEALVSMMKKSKINTNTKNLISQRSVRDLVAIWNHKLGKKDDVWLAEADQILANQKWEAVSYSITDFEASVTQILTDLGISHDIQYLVNTYHADLYLPEHSLIIECLGPSHFTLLHRRIRGQDLIRQKYLESLVMRCIFLDHEAWVEWNKRGIAQLELQSIIPVSYTHLTLPTIYSV
eukprot:TRINITY_DN7812_c0_g1_i1.p1 TRINITY_DN7812_c0_g1~~TRINITY_DN7812_c0_g1_i1.p1  ORF type:complete len:532 (+),score=40.21 TRINITY_DN7812_c0_g1_i1:92-1687(+)